MKVKVVDFLNVKVVRRAMNINDLSFSFKTIRFSLMFRSPNYFIISDLFNLRRNMAGVCSPSFCLASLFSVSTQVSAASACVAQLCFANQFTLDLSSGSSLSFMNRSL